MIDRKGLYAFIGAKCNEIEERGDWVKKSYLTALQEGKLKELKGDTLALSLAEGIAYKIGNHLLFYAADFITSGQLSLDRKED